MHSRPLTLAFSTYVDIDATTNLAYSYIISGANVTNENRAQSSMNIHCRKWNGKKGSLVDNNWRSAGSLQVSIDLVELLHKIILEVIPHARFVLCVVILT